MAGGFGQVPEAVGQPAGAAALVEGVVRYDGDGAVVAFTPRAAQLLGGTDESLDGLVDLVDADGAPVESPVVRALREGRDQRGVLLGVTGAGGRPRRWLECNVVVHADGSGATLAALDVTDRRSRERALTEAHAHFRAVFAGAAIGMAVLDLRGGVISGNRALTDVLRHDPTAIVGEAFTDLVRPNDVAEVRRAIDDVLAGQGGSRRIEARLRRGDEDVWAQLDITALRDADEHAALVLVQVQDVSERRRDSARLQHLADHDPLTGLLNRRGFTRELEHQADRSARYGPDGALLLVDLDEFKRVNDTLGHDVGDQVLRDVAAAIASRTRASDIVARLGGDEFAILVPHGGTEAAEHLAAGLLDALRTDGTVQATGSVQVTASIGIAAFDGELDADGVLVRADTAMYGAKEGGRDGAAHWEPADGSPVAATERLRSLTRIRTAIEEDRLRLLAQPIVSVASGRPVMHELLLRMVGEQGELLVPAEFLELAERFDLVQDLDRWVVARACELLGRARRDAHPLAVTVNLSAKSVGNPRLLTTLRTELESSGADPRDLVLELTETSAVAQIQRAREFADAATQLGCRLAIDDFGAGFGSFHYLKHLPFDFLKIDGEFVAGAPGSRTDALIVDAVRDLAHGLGRQVVAEWVADPALREWLVARGVDLLQGHGIGRPVPVETILPGDPVA